MEPEFELDVVGKGRFKVPDDQSGVGGLTIETYNGTNLKIGGNSTYSWIQSHAMLPLYINELGNNTLFNVRDGNVGIGTISPSYKLDVKGRAAVESLYVKKLDITNDGVHNSTINSGGVAYINMGFDSNTGYVKFGTHTGNGHRGDILYMRGSDGNVGIGIANPDSKLTVSGNIHAQEIKVATTTGAVPDYVFANDYKLKTLCEVENYIKKNSHLPEIPSA